MTKQSLPAIHEIRESLATAATLGTSRRAFEVPQAPGKLGAAFAHIKQDGENERALLTAAALVTSYARAGYRAPQLPADATIQAAGEDTLPICSSAAAQHLATMLGGSNRSVLPEWLSLLAERKQRVPPHLLPELLDAGRQTPELHVHLRSAIGVRGQWLAAQNSDWHYASVSIGENGANAKEIWETGTRATRLALLEELRSTRPRHARELIESTWSSEKADDRAAFVEKMSPALSMDDEPFLEAALDDRSKEVRRIASELLSKLPQSRLVQRMIERVTPLLRWNPPGNARLFGLMQGKKGSIEVTLPDECDKAMARDGIDPKPTQRGDSMGERAIWLSQMLSLIPPSHWTTAWQAPPEAIIAAARAHDQWKTPLVRGLMDATVRTGDAVWAAGWLQHEPPNQALLSLLPIDRKEAVLLDLLKKLQGNDLYDKAFTLLRGTTHQWSVALSRAVLTSLLRSFNKPAERHDYTLNQLLTEAAYRLSPALLPEIMQFQPDSEEGQTRWRYASERMVATLLFRYEMDKALSQSETTTTQRGDNP